MKIFITTFKAIDPLTGKLENWMGEDVVAETWEDAEEYVRTFLGHLTVEGELMGSESINPEFNFNLN